MSALTEIVGGKLRVNFHRGQQRAWDSIKRFVAVLAGSQSGKTSFGPLWLWREIQKRGPGDYMVVTPTYPLLNLKALPEFLRLFQRTLQLGYYTASARKFTLSAGGAARMFGRKATDADPETCVYFGHASDPESLESATAKAAWLDEAGQKKFRLGSWEALQRRLSIHQGRALITTTPYDLGWLKQRVWDKWRTGDADIEVVNFSSKENPAFPLAEFERARASLPAWKFSLFYLGLFSRPAGLIYDCFDDRLHVVPRFAVSPKWQRYLGLDFGGVNTAGVFFAEEPETGRLYAYREYRAGGRTAAEHTKALLAGEPMIPLCVGGSKSEGQWRAEFASAGLPVREPDVSEVEVGIDRVYGAIKRNELYVFPDLAGLLDELQSYSREVDDRGEPTEKIQDKETFHVLDATRYIISWAKRNGAPFEIGLPTDVKDGQSYFADDAIPAGVFHS